MRLHGNIMADPPVGEGIPELIREAIREARDWLSAEIEVARAQIVEAVGNYASAAIACAMAALLAFLGLIYLGFALILVLSDYVGAPAAALTVGGILLIAALAAFFYGRAKFRTARIVPRRLIELLGQERSRRNRRAP
jgi:hypothetical protein